MVSVLLPPPICSDVVLVVLLALVSTNEKPCTPLGTAVTRCCAEPVAPKSASKSVMSVVTVWMSTYLPVNSPDESRLSAASAVMPVPSAFSCTVTLAALATSDAKDPPVSAVWKSAAVSASA